MPSREQETLLEATRRAAEAIRKRPPRDRQAEEELAEAERVQRAQPPA